MMESANWLTLDGRDNRIGTGAEDDDAHRTDEFGQLSGRAPGAGKVHAVLADSGVGRRGRLACRRQSFGRGRCRSGLSPVGLKARRSLSGG